MNPTWNSATKYKGKSFLYIFFRLPNNITKMQFSLIIVILNWNKALKFIKNDNFAWVFSLSCCQKRRQTLFTGLIFFFWSYPLFKYRHQLLVLMFPFLYNFFISEDLTCLCNITQKQMLNYLYWCNCKRLYVSKSSVQHTGRFKNICLITIFTKTYNKL